MLSHSGSRTKQELEGRVVDQERELTQARNAINTLRAEKNQLTQHHQKIQVEGATGVLSMTSLSGLLLSILS